MYTIERICKLPHYVGIVLNEPKVRKYDSDESSSLVKGDELMQYIFAPDPFTGIPRSDIGLMLSKDSSPEVANYIQQHIMSVSLDSSNCGDDADFALETTRSRYESDREYASRLRDIIRKYSKVTK